MQELAPWEGEYNPKEEIAKLQKKARGRFANDSGLDMEKAIIAACQQYEHYGHASVTKVPEPFRVLRKNAGGKANIQFTSHAQPDFMGVLKGGRCICFESKYTSTDKLKYSALTETQANALEVYWKMGACAAVCCGIGDKYYFIPWATFRSMKEIFGRAYVTHNDIKEFEVRFTGAVMFLDPKNDYIPIKKNRKTK